MSDRESLRRNSAIRRPGMAGWCQFCRRDMDIPEGFDRGTCLGCAERYGYRPYVGPLTSTGYVQPAFPSVDDLLDVEKL